ncbi:MAG: NAD(+)/NADH kinase [Phycisphaerales bacterium]
MTVSKRSTLLVVNADKPDAQEASKELAALITEHGVLLGQVPSANGKLPDEAKNAELIVVLGGDGTLLGEGRRFAGGSAPLLGVNVGKLGFLAEFDLAAIRDQAATLFGAGDLRTRSVPLLDVEITDGNGDSQFVGSAMNEAVVTAGPPYRVIELGIRINGTKGPAVRGDGLIVSTSLGSTAYNVSAGGPIVHPMVDATVITPIAAHSLAFRPIAVPGDSVIELDPIQINESDTEGTTLVLDGQIQRRITGDQRVRITRASRAVELVVNQNGDYWDTLVGKLHWGKQPTYGDQ